MAVLGPKSDDGTYVHRSNRDGTYDSICPMCFRTVISHVDRMTLAFAESAHKCEPGDLHIQSQRMVAEK
jgi:hypothetical protein